MVSAAFRKAIAGPHTPISRVELWYGGSPVDRDLPVVEGGVSGSRSLIRRTADLTLREGYGPARQALWEAVSKPGMELRITRGVRFLDGSVEEASLGTFLVRTPRLDVGTGTISLSSCPDQMQRVIDARFEMPRSSRAGFTYAQQIQSLVGEVVDRLRFRDQLMNGSAVPSAVWERERGDAVVQVATAAGGETWFAADGALVLGRPPTFADPAVWTLTDRTSVLVSAQVEVDWSTAYNAVVASGERTDGSPPVFYTARDLDPLSVTYWDGPMGPKPRFYSSPLLTSANACKAAAVTLLFKSVGSRKQLSLESVANPEIDVASRVDVTIVGESISERHIVDSFRLPLFSAGMSMTTRSVDAVVSE